MKQTACIPLIGSVSKMPLRGLIIVDHADVRAFGHHISVTEVHAVCDVGEEEEVWVSPLVDDPEPAASNCLR